MANDKRWLVVFDTDRIKDSPAARHPRVRDAGGGLAARIRLNRK